MPRDDFDDCAHGDAEEHAVVLELGARTCPLGCRFLPFTVGCQDGLGIGCVAKTEVEQSTRGRVEARSDDGRNDEVDVFSRGHGEDQGIGAWAPSDHVDGFLFVAELGAPQQASCEELPYAYDAVVASTSQPDTRRINCETSHPTFVTTEEGRANGREWLQLFRAGKFG